MKEEIDDKMVSCSGCGYRFRSANPEKWYQFCSGECRDMVQGEVDEIVDYNHFVTLLWSGDWIQRLLNTVIKHSK